MLGLRASTAERFPHLTRTHVCSTLHETTPVKSGAEMETVRIYRLKGLAPSTRERLRTAQLEAARVWNVCRETETGHRWAGSPRSSSPKRGLRVSPFHGFNVVNTTAASTSTVTTAITSHSKRSMAARWFALARSSLTRTSSAGHQPEAPQYGQRGNSS